jgi:hypothetical protein
MKKQKTMNNSSKGIGNIWRIKKQLKNQLKFLRYEKYQLEINNRPHKTQKYLQNEEYYG